MNRYIDIRLRPDPEFPSQLLMNALFAKLHRGLAKLGSGRVGVSFPDIETEGLNGLGNHLRLHGGQNDLQRLMALQWETGLRDLIDLGEIRPVPEKNRHRIVQRVQAKSSAERLRRRYMKRHGADELTAREAIPEQVAERLDLPFISLSSQSTGQRFNLFIRHGPLQDNPVTGRFSSYGLSSQATIPWF